MFWVWLGFALVLGLVAGFAVAAKVSAKMFNEEIAVLRREKAHDQDTMMRTFRRELANWLFRSDPDRYQALYDRARRLEREILAADPIERKAMLRRIAEEIPTINEFDLLQTREYIPYGDAIWSLDDAEKRYLDIVSWQALQIAMNPAWKWVKKPTSDDDEKHLPEVAARLRDGRFRKRLEQTMRLFWFARRGTDELAIDNNLFTVKRIPHFAESRYGIHLKDSNEFGIYSMFHDIDRSFENYYRSNSDFSAENPLRNSFQEEPDLEGVRA